VDTFDLIGLGRQFFPRLVAVAILLALMLAPNFSAGLIMRAAESRTRQFTKLLDPTHRSAFDSPPRHRPRR
jgi:hypothetical protein